MCVWYPPPQALSWGCVMFGSLDFPELWLGTPPLRTLPSLVSENPEPTLAPLKSSVDKKKHVIV